MGFNSRWLHFLNPKSISIPVSVDGSVAPRHKNNQVKDRASISIGGQGYLARAASATFSAHTASPLLPRLTFGSGRARGETPRATNLPLAPLPLRNRQVYPLRGDNPWCQVIVASISTQALFGTLGRFDAS